MNVIRPIDNYIKVGKIKPIFKNQTVYLIGGGPSLIDFDWNLLNNKNVIAINKAFLYYPKADMLYWSDTRFYKWYKRRIDIFNGLKITNKGKIHDENIICLRDSGVSGLDTDPSCLRHGNNSGYAAINLAVHTGANKIYLLGYDMGNIGNKTHFHDGYNLKHNPGIYKKHMIPQFQSLVEPLKELKIEIFNANPTSLLNCFTKCTIEEAFNQG